MFPLGCLPKSGRKGIAIIGSRLLLIICLVLIIPGASFVSAARLYDPPPTDCGANSAGLTGYDDISFLTYTGMPTSQITTITYTNAGLSNSVPFDVRFTSVPNPIDPEMSSVGDRARFEDTSLSTAGSYTVVIDFFEAGTTNPMPVQASLLMIDIDGDTATGRYERVDVPSSDVLSYATSGPSDLSIATVITSGTEYIRFEGTTSLPALPENSVQVDFRSIPTISFTYSKTPGTFEAVFQLSGNDSTFFGGSAVCTPVSDADGDSVYDIDDIDDDDDGILDADEGRGDTDDDLIPDYLDLDSDGDGIRDVVEGGGTDLDGDGRADGNDLDGDGLPGSADPDDGGSLLPLPDTDADGLWNFQDLDSENDGILDNNEAYDANADGAADVPPSGLDSDGDGLDDAFDLDQGGTPAPEPDIEGDGVPNWLDLDSDGDGILDSVELSSGDTDSDGLPDYLDLDSDNDGILDSNEAFDVNADGVPDVLPAGLDNDGDGLDDAFDPDQGGTAAPEPDRDGDGTPNWRDIDSDGDGMLDVDEGLIDSDGDGIVEYLDPYLPPTGFAPGVITVLPAQPKEISYMSLGGVWLEIPKLGMSAAITGIPQSEGSWDVTWLSDQVGWLIGTAFPGYEGNTVLTGHVYDSNGYPGPFVKIKDLRYGDQIKIHLFGSIYTYEVRDAYVTSRGAAPLQHKDYDWVTLITCKSYNLLTDSYQYRQIVQAVLIQVASE